MNVFNKSYAIILMMILTLLCVTAVFSNGNDTLHSQVNDFHVFRRLCERLSHHRTPSHWSNTLRRYWEIPLR